MNYDWYQVISVISWVVLRGFRYLLDGFRWHQVVLYVEKTELLYVLIFVQKLTSY